MNELSKKRLMIDFFVYRYKECTFTLTYIYNLRVLIAHFAWS